MNLFQFINEFSYGIYAGLYHNVWNFRKSFGKARNMFTKRTGENDSIIPQEIMPLEVLAVGYGRTGTYSLRVALEELGYPTLHTQHMYENPGIMHMWVENVFLPAIKNKKISMGSPDLDVITSHGFKAAADLPMALYFAEIYDRYPECKFILTTRENSEIWYRSWETMTINIFSVTNFGAVTGSPLWPHVRQLAWYLRWLFSIVYKDVRILETPLGSPLPPISKENAIASYEEHNRRVRELIPADRLLEYNVNQGWAPLCQFLEIDTCPHTPFPKTNTALSLRVQVSSSILVPLGIILFIIFSLFSIIFKKATGEKVFPWIERKWLWRRKSWSLPLKVPRKKRKL